jgi:hypothetical protein
MSLITFERFNDLYDEARQTPRGSAAGSMRLIQRSCRIDVLGLRDHVVISGQDDGQTSGQE